ncbi:MAG: glucosyl-3-phosphoglycerate synthase [Spirochaetales bacterium]|nr:glucosyl-3-phosphoglycerate synthase [Spirochaetales bacterium]
MKTKQWIQDNTYHYSQFNDIGALVDKKREKNLKISLCLPTLNEEKTIAKEIIIMRSELMHRFPLLDEIVVIDSGSTDNTREIAKSYGADVYLADDILPHIEKFKGKGENLWKAQYVLEGDIIVYIDADIKNIHHRFAYGLIGPLLLRDEVKYSKAFYDRPIAVDTSKLKPSGGGRVTELVIRPLFSLFTPQLAQIIQPLSGEYAGYREILEQLSFPLGYGIETSMLLDILGKWGIDIIAQVDLDKRIHRNQDTLSLGRMAFGIMQTFINRAEKMGLLSVADDLHHSMIQFSQSDENYSQDIHQIQLTERPPIITIPEYREKFGRS